MFNFRLLKNSDYALWICMAFLILIGFLSIYSTTFAMLTRKAAIFTDAHIDPLNFIKRHFITLILGLVFMAFFTYIDYNNYKKITSWLYGIMIFLLLVVIVIGFESYGAQRWIGIGFFSFQPSEIAKLILILSLAKFIEPIKGLQNLNQLVPAAILAGIPFLLIFKQPDLGTALVFLAIMAGMIMWAQNNIMVLFLLFTPLLSALCSLSWFVWVPYLIVLAVALYFLIQPKTADFISIYGINILTGLAIPIIWNLLKDYQKQRLLIFLNPSTDPYGAGYHTIQSQIAIGAGGLFGKGFLQGTQTQLQFIPQQWTDFVFSMIGEEFGLIGALVIIAVFGVIIWRAITIAMNAKDFYGSLIASGIAAMFTFHVVVNIAMTLGIAPVVGIPLPFISFGGTSLIMNMCAIGILQSISMRRVTLFF